MLCLIAAVFAAAFAGPATAQIAVSDAWVRGTVAGQMSTGAFMRLSSPADTTLVGVASPAAKVVELHEMKMDGGMMKMSAVGRLPLPAGKSVELKPGGYHIMLMDLVQPLKEGDVVPVTLTFEDRAGVKQTIAVKAPVRSLGK
jgi:hypothetical protein